MKKRRKISMAWFLFFAAMSCLLVNQWGRIASVLAGFALACWLTSRIKLKLLYTTWLIFPLLCFFCLNSLGNRVVNWTDENSPRFVTDRVVYYFKEISDGKLSEAAHNLTYKTPEPKQWLINKTRDVFQKSVSEAKGITKKISEKKLPDQSASS